MSKEKVKERTRGLVMGEDVLWYPGADRRNAPRLAKVIEVDGKDGRLAKLYHYATSSTATELCFHIDSPMFAKFKDNPIKLANYREKGGWDFHPQSAALFDLVEGG